MKVLLLDMDSGTSKKQFPNLALMKLSAYFKSKGDTVGFNETDSPDIVYASVVFSRNKHLVDGLKMYYPDSKIIVGGSGYDLTSSLNDEIEFIKPDYSLYNCDFSMGFTSRGCIRNCPFCIVNKKEGSIKNWQAIQGFHEESHKHAMLLDNNFLASPNWKQNIDYIREKGLSVDFNQGLDVRLITKDVARILVDTKIRPYVRISFDSLHYETQFRAGIQNLIDAGMKPRNILVYVLVGFTDSTFEADMKRVMIVWKQYGAEPYVMRYNHISNNKLKKERIEYTYLAKWANRHYFTVCDFEDYIPNKKRKKR
ncbi:Uncharacterised protein [uncultured archaeon]|nr:Uncharacterised protein [uncultured archaeon]